MLEKGDMSERSNTFFPSREVQCADEDYTQSSHPACHLRSGLQAPFVCVLFLLNALLCWRHGSSSETLRVKGPDRELELCDLLGHGIKDQLIGFQTREYGAGGTTRMLRVTSMVLIRWCWW